VADLSKTNIARRAVDLGYISLVTSSITPTIRSSVIDIILREEDAALYHTATMLQIEVMRLHAAADRLLMERAEPGSTTSIPVTP
jgi:hypothetical protein